MSFTAKPMHRIVDSLYMYTTCEYDRWAISPTEICYPQSDQYSNFAEAVKVKFDRRNGELARCHTSKQKKSVRAETIEIPGMGEFTILDARPIERACGCAKAYCLHNEYTGTRILIVHPDDRPARMQNPPTVFIQAEGIDSIGIEKADHPLINSLAAITGHADPSRWQLRRTDIATDIRSSQSLRMSDVGFADEVAAHLVSRCRWRTPYFDPDLDKITTHYDKRQGLTGMTFGSHSTGRQMVLYDKLAEARTQCKKSDRCEQLIAKGIKQGWLYNQDAITSCRGGDTVAQDNVYRVEHRLSRSWLRTWGIETLQHLRDKYKELGKHLHESWRMCDPTDDTNRSRWPVKEWWQKLIDFDPTDQHLTPADLSHCTPELENYRAIAKTYECLLALKQLSYNKPCVHSALDELRADMDDLEHHFGQGEPLCTISPSSQITRLQKWGGGEIDPRILAMAKEIGQGAWRWRGTPPTEPEDGINHSQGDINVFITGRDTKAPRLFEEPPPPCRPTQ
ncbi:MAG: hypothetical protein ACP5O7_08690 [Phycisphaerae bacterium]